MFIIIHIPDDILIIDTVALVPPIIYHCNVTDMVQDQDNIRYVCISSIYIHTNMYIVYTTYVSQLCSYICN